MAASLADLDQRAENIITRYLGQVADHDTEYLLAEDDAMSAAHLADTIYLRFTDMPAAECLDRALDIAFRIQGEMRYAASFPTTV